MKAEMKTPELDALIDERDFESLRKEIQNWPAGDLADLMEPLPAEKEAVVFRLLPRSHRQAPLAGIAQQDERLLAGSQLSLGRADLPVR